MDSQLLDQIRHLCRDRSAYEHLKAILVQQERVHQISWQDHYERLLASQSADSSTSNLLSNIIAREKALAQLADTMQRSPSLDLILQVAVQVAQKLLQVDRVAIFRFHSDGRGEFVTDAIATGVESFANMPERQLALARHMAESLPAEPEGQLEEQIVASISNSSLAAHIDNLLEEIGISAYAANKIHAGQEIWGTLVAFYGNNHQSCSESDRTSLSLIAAQIGIAISLTNLRQQSQVLTEDLQSLKNEIDNLHQVVAEIAASDNQSLQNLVVKQELDVDQAPIPQETTVVVELNVETNVETEAIDGQATAEPAIHQQKTHSLANIDSDFHEALAALPTENHPVVSEVTEVENQSIPLTVPLAETDLTISINENSKAAITDDENITSVDLARNFEQADSDSSIAREIPAAAVEPETAIADPIEAQSAEHPPEIIVIHPPVIDEPLVAMTQDLDIADAEVSESEQQDDAVVHVSQLEQAHKLPIDLRTFLEQETHPVIELQFLETIANRDRNLALEIIDAYLQETPPLVQAIDQALASNDHHQLWQSIYKLRSSSAQVGALTLVYQCRQLESSIKANYVVLIYACFARVAIESQRAIEAINNLRSQYI